LSNPQFSQLTNQQAPKVSQNRFAFKTMTSVEHKRRMIDILIALCNIFLKMNPLTTVEAAAFFELAQNPTVNNFARLNQFLFW